MKQFGWQEADCFTPAMQRQKRHDRQELIAAPTERQASWWLTSGGDGDLPRRLSDECCQRGMTALFR